MHSLSSVLAALGQDKHLKNACQKMGGSAFLRVASLKSLAKAAARMRVSFRVSVVMWLMSDSSTLAASGQTPSLHTDR
jgi:hypothetical protein